MRLLTFVVVAAACLFLVGCSGCQGVKQDVKGDCLSSCPYRPQLPKTLKPCSKKLYVRQPDKSWLTVWAPSTCYEHCRGVEGQELIGCEGPLVK